MKKTKLRRFLPVFLTLLTVIVCTIGITVMADTDERSNQITHANIVINDDVDLVFWADISEENAQNKETFMTFNDGTPVSYSYTETLDGVTYAIFRYNNIRPQDIATVITAKLYVNGVFTSFIDYSVKDYCQYILNHKSSDSLKTLVSDLLVYGEEAQSLTQENVENLATSGVTGLTATPAPDRIKVLYGTETTEDLARGATATITQSKLLMDNGAQLYFNVELPVDADASEYTVCMTVNGREQEVKVTSAGYFNRAFFDSVYVHELFDNVQINVYKGNIRVSNSMTFSIASYVDALYSDPKYTALTGAFYNLGYSAHVYGGSHSIVMPGDIVSDENGSTTRDASGLVTYNCSLCGTEIDTLQITHLRTFDALSSNGAVINRVDNKSLFSMTTEAETLDGVTNKYLSIVRNTTLDKGEGGFGYYFTTEQARKAALPEDELDSLGQYRSRKFTFSFDVKSPAGGLAAYAFHLQNTNTSGTGRYGRVLDIGVDGSISDGTSTIAPAGTVNTAEWTNVTITLDFYESNGVEYIYTEYYIDGVLVSTSNSTNPMLNNKFNRIYISTHTDGVEDGDGIFFDNFMFAQGCVHPFTDKIADYVAKVGSGNIRKLVDKIQNDFELNDFSWVVRHSKGQSSVYKEYQPFMSLDTSVHPDPLATPKSYSHPRLLFNSSDIPDIVENIEKEENAHAKSVFMSFVNSSTDGKLVPTSSFQASAFEYTNYDTSVFRAIEAKALYYALYKDDTTGQHTDAVLRGYQAIYAIKNCLLTFDVQWKASDQCRYYGELAYFTALVYDWCYDLLTDEDKLQLRTGAQNLAFDGTNNQPWMPGNTHEGRKFEGGFPALAVEAQSVLTGHGAEAQVLRDYFSFAVAIFDEDPTWYDYVGGMIYNWYVEPRNYFYSSGFYPDGSAGYNTYRYLCDLYNAWIFDSMGVEFPYNAEDMETVVHGLMAMETYDNYQFATADGSGTSWLGQSRIGDNVGECALISSYLFDDPAALAIAERIIGYRWNQNFSSSQLGISAGYYLILTSNGLTPSENYREKINEVEYHGGFQQQIISREDFTAGSPVLLLQGAQHYPGGHTHQNAGSFQIWYKGILSRDDGLYDAYGSDHHFFYHMSATAHNTLLIHNYNLDSVPLGPSNKIGYYNGGQKYELGIPQTYKGWIKDQKFSYGKLIGIEYDNEEDPSYVYFANDITNAYDESTVDYVERSIMTLYTGDDETPMVMFIYDNITSDQADYKKTFLLQCAEAPEINGNVITVDNGSGKMVLTSLLGADDIKAYGRTSKDGVVMPEEYFFTDELIEDENGRQPGDKGYITTYKYSKEYGAERFYLSGANTALNPGGAEMIGDKNTDLGIVWGHVEVSPNATQTTNQLVNVIYVSDSGTVVTETPTLVEGNFLTGATFKNHTSMFVSDPMHSSDEMSFTTTGEGTMTYYIGGLNEGTWKVTVNGEFLGEFAATEEGKMITFDASAGEILLSPGENMRDPNTGLIFYYANGGTLPEGAPNLYYYGTETALPTPTKEGSTFEGWFLDKDFKEPIYVITAEARESFRLYAKWSSPIVYADYTQGGTTSDYTQFAYSPEASGATFKLINGKENYLLWNVPSTSGGSIIGKDGPYAVHANESLQVSFSITLGRDGQNPILPTSIYLRDAKYESPSPYRFMNIFKTDANGNAYLGQHGTPVKFAQIPTSGMITLHFVLDFENGKMIAYNENAEEIASVDFSAIGINYPEEYGSYANWFKNLSANGNSIISWKGAGSGSLRVGAIRVMSGNLTKSCRYFGINSDTHTWSEGEVIKEAGKDNCTPGLIRYTCLECELVKDVPIISEAPHASITSAVENNKITYTCSDCGCTFKPETNFYLDGTSHNGIIGVGNSEHYKTEAGTHQPIINGNGEYELINKTGENGNIELWIPSKGNAISGFSSDNLSKGFLSFKVNALTDNNFSFNFVDTSSTASKWTDGWCLTDSFFTISAPKTENGVTTVKVTGWDGITLEEISVTSEQSFTGWIDIQILIELDPYDDKITLTYYLNGKIVGSVSKELTTLTNSINSVCITGSTSMESSGIKLDDISFGYSTNASWESN